LLVAVGNQSAVEELVALAAMLAQADQDRILVLNLAGNEQGQAAVGDRIDAAVQQLAEQGLTAREVFGSADSAARNVLDTAREANARLILLGVRPTKSRREGLGTLVENVVAAATCPVAIYRLGTAPSFSRLLAPTNAGEPSRLALEIGLQLAGTQDLPIEALYIRTNGESAWEARVRLAAALEGLEGRERVQRRIDADRDPVRGIFKHAADGDLLLAGYTRRSEVETWFYGDVSQALLSSATGPVLLVAGPQGAAPAQGRWQRLLQWIRPTLTPFEQDELAGQARSMARPSLDYVTMISIAAILASFGLLANSGAVIIGAMLVAPLMSPLIAFAIGMTVGRLSTVRWALLTVLQGFAIAFGLPWLIGVLLTSSTLITPEMAARGNPTIIDLGVALASGFVAAYATARKHIPAALAGVAIAAALVPPICSSALGLALGDTALFWGAGLLFVTNVVSIILAAWLTFFFLGMRPPVEQKSHRNRYISGSLVGAFVVLAISLYALAVDPASEQRIEAQIRETLRFDELVDMEVRRESPLAVIATIRRSSDRLNDNSEILLAEQQLEALLGRDVALNAVVQPIVSQRTVVLTILESGFAPHTLVDLRIDDQVDQPLLVVATVRGAAAAAIEERVLPTRRALTRTLREPVQLELNLQLSAAADTTAQVALLLLERLPTLDPADFSVFESGDERETLIVVIDSAALSELPVESLAQELQSALGRAVQVELR
jgi:uncharacterized hydrophobic protein (TIGR00271 family)